MSFGTNQYTAWVKTDPDDFLVRHMVDVQKAAAKFREASARKHDTSSQAYGFDNNVTNRSPVQKKLSIYYWKRGLRRGKEGAFEKQTESKWHVIKLHEAIEYVDQDILTNWFHVTLYGGCAIFHNNDILTPSLILSKFTFMKPSAIYLFK